MPKYRALLFDLFHTLVDVASAPDSEGRYTADILGVDRRRWSDACFSDHHDICAPTRHIDTVRTLALAIDPEIPEALITEATEERQRRFDHTLLNVESDILATLQRLRGRGYRLGLVSNASTGEVSAWPRSPLAPLFDVATFSCECGSRKPEPAIYLQTLERLGHPVERALFLGDGGSSEHLGARRLGIDNVLVSGFLDDGGRVAERRLQAKWEIARIAELPELLAAIDPDAWR